MAVFIPSFFNCIYIDFSKNIHLCVEWKHCTCFTVMSSEALWTVTQVGARPILTRSSVHARLRQALIYVLRR